MKKNLPLLILCLCLALLTACGAPAPAETPSGETPPAEDGPAPSPAEDETPAYLTCRIVDGAEDGALLLAALDAPLYGGHDSPLSDGRGVYRLSVTESTPVYLDGQPVTAADLRNGMPLEVAFNGEILETFPARFGEVYSVSGYSIGTRQSPGGTFYDLCGLYLQALDDLWHKDPALNEDIAMVSLDLSQAPGELLESEKSALVWRFGELHGVEALALTFQELEEQGYLTSSAISTPAPEEGQDFSRIWNLWEDGCLFTIRANSGHEGEVYSLPALFFDVEKWRTPLAAYCLYDCSALWPEMGTWDGYQIGAEMIS